MITWTTKPDSFKSEFVENVETGFNINPVLAAVKADNEALEELAVLKEEIEALKRETLKDVDGKNVVSTKK